MTSTWWHRHDDIDMMTSTWLHRHDDMMTSTWWHDDIDMMTWWHWHDDIDMMTSTWWHRHDDIDMMTWWHRHDDIDMMTSTWLTWWYRDYNRRKNWIMYHIVYHHADMDGHGHGSRRYGWTRTRITQIWMDTDTDHGFSIKFCSQTSIWQITCHYCTFLCIKNNYITT